VFCKSEWVANPPESKIRVLESRGCFPFMLMATNDFSRSRLDQMINLRHPLAVLSQKMPWGMLVESLRPVFEHRDRKGRQFFTDDMFGQNLQIAGAGVNKELAPEWEQFFS
jgi:response regulator of citrate/malate metabolism